jgi:hypothetical protein
MAVVTLQRRCKMVFGLTRSGTTIVAARTGPGDRVVIEISRRPRNGAVAHIALSARLDMIIILARCDTAIVAA